MLDGVQLLNLDLNLRPRAGGEKLCRNHSLFSTAKEGNAVQAFYFPENKRNKGIRCSARPAHLGNCMCPEKDTPAPSPFDPCKVSVRSLEKTSFFKKKKKPAEVAVPSSAVLSGKTKDCSKGRPVNIHELPCVPFRQNHSLPEDNFYIEPLPPSNEVHSAR